MGNPGIDRTGDSRSSSYFMFVVAGLAVAAAVANVLATDWRTIDCNGDNLYHAAMAKTVFSGHAFCIPVVFYHIRPDPSPSPGYSYPPLHSVILALLYRAFGEDYYLGVVFNCLVGVLIIFPLIRLGKHIGSQWAGLGAFVLLASNVWMLFTVTKQLTEPLYILFALWSAVFLLEARDSWKPGKAILAGLLAGLAYLARYNGGPLAAAAVVFLLVARKHPLRLRASLGSLFVISFLVTVSPWLVRNWIEFRDPFFYAIRNLMWIKETDPLTKVFAITPSAATYFANHTIGDFLGRIGRGLLAYVEVLMTVGNASPILLVVLALALGRTVVANGKGLFWWVLLTALPPMAIYPSYSERHILPILPFVYLLVCSSLFPGARRGNALSSRTVNIVVSSLAVLVLAASLDMQLRNNWRLLTGSRPFSRLCVQIGNWLRADTREDDVVMMGYPIVAYYFGNRAAVMAPQGTPVGEMDAVVRRYGITVFISLDYYGDPPTGFGVVDELSDQESPLDSRPSVKVYRKGSA